MIREHLLTIIFCLLTIVVNGEPREINMTAELLNAKMVGKVIIDSIDVDSLYFHSPGEHPEQSTNVCLLKARHLGAQPGSIRTGYLPKRGDLVMIIIDSNNMVSLFAVPQGNSYRFWSPYSTGSSAFFIFKKPFRKLNNAPDQRTSSGELACWDGCLVDTGLFQAMVVHRGAKMTGNGKSYFSWFIPDGYAILDSISGNLNMDEYADMILILRQKGEDTLTEQRLHRLMLLLTGQRYGYKESARSETVVSSVNFCNLMGNTYTTTTIKKGTFSVRHVCSGTPKMQMVTTFTYNAKQKYWYCTAEVVQYWDPNLPDQPVKKKVRHNLIKFDEYDIYNRL